MMKKYKYIKSNAFTAGALLGNPAACVFTGKETLSPEQMQAVAREHKGFVMEVVFCGQSDVADCKLTYTIRRSARWISAVMAPSPRCIR